MDRRGGIGILVFIFLPCQYFILSAFLYFVKRPDDYVCLGRYHTFWKGNLQDLCTAKNGQRQFSVSAHLKSLTMP